MKKKDDYFNDCYDDLITSFFEEIGNANMIMVLVSMMMIMPIMPALNVIGKKSSCTHAHYLLIDPLEAGGE